MDFNRDMMNDIFHMTKENNQMLHAMRRNAFWGGLLKFAIYAALLSAPIWFYMTYLNDAVQKMLRAIDEVNGTGPRASAQVSGFEQAFKDFESKLPAFLQSPASSRK